MGVMEPHGQCIALHLYDGYISILPINPRYKYTPGSATSTSNTTVSSRSKKSMLLDLVGTPFHCCINERALLHMTFLLQSTSSSSSLSSSINNMAMHTYLAQLALLLMHGASLRSYLKM
mmetsp:Transcript_12951/g.18492  ORF Transcript_12951/g.18492 Transcript_12951/m.18492 type:complete len:119 (+) Transcript_12951:145-501(+)